MFLPSNQNVPHVNRIVPIKMTTNLSDFWHHIIYNRLDMKCVRCVYIQRHMCAITILMNFRKTRPKGFEYRQQMMFINNIADLCRYIIYIIAMHMVVKIGGFQNV